MKQPLISIILVNYQSAASLERFFTSLERLSLPREAYETIVSNNDAGEVTALDTLSARYPFQVIHHAENLGFGAANNRAADIAQGDHLLFCNPDTEFVSGELAPTSFSSGITGFRLVDTDGRTEAWSVGPDVSLWEIIRNNLGFSPGKRLWNSTEPIRVGRVSGAALAIPRTLFQNLGGFDEDFFLYFEDADLCHRARQAGHAVTYHPHIIFRHQGGHSMLSKKEQKRHYYASQTRYFNKHRPAIEQGLLRILSRLHI